jgi:hypothetical protein
MQMIGQVCSSKWNSELGSITYISSSSSCHYCSLQQHRKNYDEAGVLFSPWIYIYAYKRL